MSSVILTIPAGVSAPANVYPKHLSAAGLAPQRPPTVPTPRQPLQAQAAAQAAEEHHHAASAAQTTALSAQALSSTDVSYVESLMGALPAQKMEEILLKTGVPIPANLGPNVDTAA